MVLMYKVILVAVQIVTVRITMDLKPMVVTRGMSLVAVERLTNPILVMAITIMITMVSATVTTENQNRLMAFN